MKSRMLILSSVLFGCISLSSGVCLAVMGNDVKVQIPRGELDLSKDNVGPRTLERMRMEANVSMWSPRGYSENSLLQDTTAFNQGDMPKVSANLLTEGWSFEQFHLFPKFGLSFARIERSGNLDVAGQAVKTSETANVTFFRAGVELTPAAAIFGNLQFSGGVSVLPGWAQISRSEFGQGVSRVALSWEQYVAFTCWAPKTAAALGTQDLGFELGLENTSGFSSSSPSGSGIMGGIRVEL